MSSYGMALAVNAPFDEVVAATRTSLAEQGFGVLTEIDVQATMRAKLGEQTGPYLILGACNPPLAFRGLTAEPSLGLLLPCNVTVRWPTDNATVVEMVDPALMVELSGNADLKPVADDAAVRLRAALNAVETALHHG